MKRIMPIMVLVLVLGALVGFVYAEKSIQLYVDGKRMSFSLPKPVRDKQNRILVATVPAAKALGLKVSYDHATKKVTFTDGETTVVMQKGKKTYTVNGKRRKMDTAPIIIKGRMLVPVRFLAEAYGAKVTYQPKKKRVNIITKKKTIKPKPTVTKPVVPKPTTPVPNPVKPPIGNPSGGSGNGGESAGGNQPVDVEEVKLPNETVGGCYVIRTVGQLQAMKKDLDGCYLLGQNIDASYTKEWNGGKGFEPVGNGIDTFFTGSMNGRGFVVSGLAIDRPDEEAIGLVNAKGATLENLSFVEADVTGARSAGIIAGRMENTVLDSSDIARSSVTVVVPDGVRDGAGGVVGLAKVSKINEVRITDITVSAGENAGGVVGYVKDSALSRMTVKNGEVVSLNDAGGVIGYGEASHIHQVNVANVVTKANKRAGGVAGTLYGGTLEKVDVTDADVQSERGAGGVAAEAKKTTIRDVSVTRAHVKVTGDGIYADSAGGAIGYAEESDVGRVHVAESEIQAQYAGGGVVGYMEGTKIDRADVSNVQVQANVLAAGVIGYMWESDVVGASVQDADVRADERAGGIVAGADKTTAHDMSVTRTHVKVTGDGNYTDTAGGAIGYATESDIQRIAVSESDVEAEYAGGGVFGYVEDTKIDRADVSNVQVQADYFAAGVIGYMWESDMVGASVQDADVRADERAGGVAGSVEESTLTDIRVVGGRFVALEDAGGVTGYADKSVLGNIHVIKVSLDSEEDAGGVASVASKSDIQNADIVDVVIRGVYHVGGVSGKAEESRLTDIRIQGGEITTEWDAGGVVGYAVDSDVSHVVVADAVMQAQRNAGGVMGYAVTTLLKDSEVKGTKLTADERAGGLIGESAGSRFEGNVVQADVKSGYRAAGLVGLSVNTALEANHVEASVWGAYAGSGIASVGADTDIQMMENSCDCIVYGGTYAGLFTFNSTSYKGDGVKVTIRDSYFVGSLETGTSSPYAAGIVAFRDTTSARYEVIIDNVYASFGFNREHSQHQPLVSKAFANTVTLQNGYYNRDTLPSLMTSVYGAGKTETEMKSESTFIGFDFVNIWAMHPDVNDGMPYLRTDTP